jgi:head-tail adaptor
MFLLLSLKRLLCSLYTDLLLFINIRNNISIDKIQLEHDNSNNLVKYNIDSEDPIVEAWENLHNVWRKAKEENPKEKIQIK